MKYGSMTVKRHTELKESGVHLRVFYRGRDVTDRCAFADDTGEGMAELYLLDADGSVYSEPIPKGEYGVGRDERQPAKQIVYGVEFRVQEPTTV